MTAKPEVKSEKTRSCSLDNIFVEHTTTTFDQNNTDNTESQSFKQTSINLYESKSVQKPIFPPKKRKHRKFKSIKEIKSALKSLITVKSLNAVNDTKIKLNNQPALNEDKKTVLRATFGTREAPRPTPLVPECFVSGENLYLFYPLNFIPSDEEKEFELRSIKTPPASPNFQEDCDQCLIAFKATQKMKKYVENQNAEKKQAPIKGILGKNVKLQKPTSSDQTSTTYTTRNSINSKATSRRSTSVDTTSKYQSSRSSNTKQNDRDQFMRNGALLWNNSQIAKVVTVHLNVNILKTDTKSHYPALENNKAAAYH